MTAQNGRLALAALLFQPGVEPIPRRKAGHRHHEVAPGIPDQPLDTAFVVPLAGPAVAVLDHVVRQQPAEQPSPLARAVRKDLRYQAPVIVVQHRLRHAAEEGKRMHMAVHPCLCRCRWIGPNITGVAVRQIEGEEIGLLLDATNENQRLTKVRLPMTRRMVQRHKHLAAAPLMLPHIGLHDRVAALKTVLVPQPFENTLGCVTLLPGTTDIIAKPLIDDVCEPVQLWPLDRRRSAVAGRYRVDNHFINAVTGDPKRPGYRPLAQALLEIRPTHLQIQFPPLGRLLRNRLPGNGWRVSGPKLGDVL